MATCPCDDRPFPPVLEIAAGLDRLPRQLAGFPEFRQALLAGIALKPALDAWRAREGDDFGLMILEWWAYVLDIVAFYSGEIANELYLATARRDASLRRLTALIGYTPTPPLAASATLVLFAAPGQPVDVPAGTAFRSDAFDGEAPQIFETSEIVQIDASRNEWTLAPIRPTTFGSGPLLLDPRTAGIGEGQLTVLTWGGTRHAGIATGLESKRLLDGELYVEVTLSPPPSIPAESLVADIRVTRPALRAGMNAFASNAVDQNGSSLTLILDALYSQLRTGGTAVVENAATGALHATTIAAVATQTVALGPTSASIAAKEDFTGSSLFEESSSMIGERVAMTSVSTADGGTEPPRAPFTKVTLSGSGPSWIGGADPAALTLHFNAVPAGRVVRSGKIEIGVADLQPSAGLVGAVQPLQLPTQSRVLLRDALELGADLAANVIDDGAGTGTLTPLGDPGAFAAPLRTPVSVFGNLVAVTRGESVAEVLGGGDATQSFQRFRLKKKPLTYLSLPGSTSGHQSTLSVWVDGVKWREVASLFLAGPEDRVYTVRQTVDGETEITFGGAGFGQPLPSGSGNVRATYRYGGGAASPPAGALRQLARPVQGVRRVVNPLAAFGGDDGDRPEDIRKAAPDSALSLGRAVSLLDFEAIARGYRGILNAAATWAWDTREQRAAVKLWFIPPTDDEGAQLRADLEAHLRAIAALGTPIAVALAVPRSKTFAVDFAIAPDRDAAAVEAAALAVLDDPDDGLLAKRRVPIGAPVFRADILAAVRAVDGVEEVRGLLCDDATAPFAITADEGEYLAAIVVRGQ